MALKLATANLTSHKLALKLAGARRQMGRQAAAARAAAPLQADLAAARAQAAEQAAEQAALLQAEVQKGQRAAKEAEAQAEKAAEMLARLKAELAAAQQVSSSSCGHQGGRGKGEGGGGGGACCQGIQHRCCSGLTCTPAPLSCSQAHAEEVAALRAQLAQLTAAAPATSMAPAAMPTHYQASPHSPCCRCHPLLHAPCRLRPTVPCVASAGLPLLPLTTA